MIPPIKLPQKKLQIPKPKKAKIIVRENFKGIERAGPMFAFLKSKLRLKSTEGKANLLIGIIKELICVKKESSGLPNLLIKKGDTKNKSMQKNIDKIISEVKATSKYFSISESFLWIMAFALDKLESIPVKLTINKEKTIEPKISGASSLINIRLDPNSKSPR